MSLNIKKLVVGCDSIKEFADYQIGRYMDFEGQKVSAVYTRFKPKQADEIIKSGGSIYRIIKGYMCCRQEIVGFEQYVDSFGTKKCLILTKPEIIKTKVVQSKPFQGWRYLLQKDAPLDLKKASKLKVPL